VPDEQSARDEPAVRDFVEKMAMTLEYWGFPRMPGRVLVAMMSADEDSLTAADLSTRLSVSPAAISGAVRYLIQFGLLERAPVPGSRRDRYRMPNGAWYEASVTKGDVLKTLADLANGGVSALGGATTPAGTRVAEMRDFFRFVQDELDDLLTRWRATKTE
jgi:predicted transcriptional regulator